MSTTWLTNGIKKHFLGKSQRDLIVKLVATIIIKDTTKKLLSIMIMTSF
jgi:hypothetical protein